MASLIFLLMQGFVTMLYVSNNGFYAANEKKKKSEINFAPILKVSTKNLPDKVEIRIRDNGNGISDSVKQNIFIHFLQQSQAVKEHAGELKFDGKVGEYTEFIIILPELFGA